MAPRQEQSHFSAVGFDYILPSAPNATYHELRHYKAYNLKLFGPAIGDVSQELCGAPVVTAEVPEEDEMGDVLGLLLLLLRRYDPCTCVR